MDVKQEKLGKMSGSSPNHSTATEGRDSDRDVESCFQAPMARIPSYRVTSVAGAAWVTFLTVPSTHARPSIASGDHTSPLLSSEAAWQWGSTWGSSFSLTTVFGLTFFLPLFHCPSDLGKKVCFLTPFLLFLS